ncbi:site-specific DNA-methyltransferase [Streptomyces caatingaensis]|uniref:site-specific DNA-methyltransferase n=1 Tax=Streptomyces caatingaensis TaxID=1678637 RepID=UPI0012FEE023|nr:site-specific DNA-methyltransferase [Streptomyces caatingaensis]
MLETGKAGDVTGTAADNLLIHGDSYDALHALVRNPEYGNHYRGKVKLVYIDPPFNTGQAFQHYDDALEHSVWLTMMRDRLLLIRDLLAPGGSVWVHLDDAEMAYCRVLMDEIFGRGNFVGTVVWQKIHARNNSAQHLSSVHDYLLVYARSKSDLVLNKIDRTELSDQEFWNPDNDPRGPWRRSDLTASHAYEDGRYEVVGPYGDVFSPRGNRWWSCSRETFDALREDNRLWWGKTGRTFPFRKRFQSELGGLVPTTFWTHDEVGDNRQAKAEVTKLFDRSRIFSTPKPEALLKRVIQIATDPGDVVVDVFAGSGTTAAVAHKMDRRWVTAELLEETVETFTRPRLEKVVAGDDPGASRRPLDGKAEAASGASRHRRPRSRSPMAASSSRIGSRAKTLLPSSQPSWASCTTAQTVDRSAARRDVLGWPLSTASWTRSWPEALLGIWTRENEQ